MLVTGLFFLWGIPNNLKDVLIRQFMTSFEFTRLKAGLVQSAFYISIDIAYQTKWSRNNPAAPR